ncbi:MAG: 2'-5' RNA ligase family protein [Anaerolineales bacterium]|nr:2'-5' RNA ligase family protein [Anaerolineales bacterium]NUQ84265.1 2'-5' RNA ligase family protein [Anaerolineales bacterium]
MKATFALLASPEVHNVVRKLSWEFHQKYRTGTRHASLPPHVSLKQPFPVSDLSALEKYMDELAGSIQPFAVTLTELRIVPVPFGGAEYGILWFDIEETEQLCGLHNRLNDELNGRFGDTAANFDGGDYRFHMSVMMGGQLLDIYQKFHSEIPNSRIDLTYTPREMAMFVYDEPIGPHSDSLCYRILQIG